jgi:hypothetical protein
MREGKRHSKKSESLQYIRIATHVPDPYYVFEVCIPW